MGVGSRKIILYLSYALIENRYVFANLRVFYAYIANPLQSALADGFAVTMVPHAYSLVMGEKSGDYRKNPPRITMLPNTLVLLVGEPTRIDDILGIRFIPIFRYV